MAINLTDAELGDIVSRGVEGTDASIGSIPTLPALADARPDELFMLSQGMMVAAGQLQALSDLRRQERVSSLREAWRNRA